MLLLVAAAIAFAGWVNAAKAREAERAARESQTPSNATVNPFADVDFGAPPERGKGTARMRTVDRSPSNLANYSPWQEAQGLARQARVLFDEGKLAKAADDYSTWNDKGRQAKALYDEALEMTAEWETEIIGLYSENDVRVADIKKLRDTWFEKIRVLHKTTSR